MKKFISVLGIIFFLIACLIVLQPSDYDEVEKLVNRDYEELTKISDDYIKYGKTDLGIENFELDSIVRGDKIMVQYLYKNTGIVNSSKYVGFYYSPEDMPMVYDGMDYKLKKLSNTEWEWNGPGDNGGGVKKIRDNFYFYEAHF